jgi:hypothetical protein
VKWIVMAGCGLVVAAAGVVAVGSGADEVTDPLGTRRADEVTARLRAAAERTRVKIEVAGALVRGELSVEEAEEHFRRVLAADPLVWSRLRAAWPDATERQLVLQNLTDFVRWQHRGDADRVPAVLARLAEARGRAADSTAPRATVVRVE